MSSFSTSADDGSAHSKLREWSSLIGIITAIVGNILISFALNIQRYAHLRLGRERRGVKQSLLKRRTGTQTTGYGTEQSAIAEERARINLDNPYSDHADGVKQSTGDASKQSDKNGRQGDEHAISLHSRRSSESGAAELEKGSSEQRRKSYLGSPYWWLGLVFMTVGEAGNFLAYGFAPASTVSPLGVVALISNCIIAPCMLKEHFRQRDFWGVAVAVAGAVIIVFSAKNSETKMGPNDIWAAISRWEFETYLGITAILIILLIWASGRYGEKTILIDLGIVGLCGGYTALSTKGLASLLSDTLWRTLTFPITYLLLFILVLTALLQIRYVNRALQRFPSTQVIPTQFVLFTISVIVGSAILYRDFKSASRDQVGKFVGGCLLTFLGVYLITSGRPQSKDFEVRGDGDAGEGPITLIDEEAYQDEVEAVNKTGPRRSSSTTALPKGLDGASSGEQSKHTSKPSFSVDQSSPQNQNSTESTNHPDNESFLTNPWQSADDLQTPRSHPPLEGTTSSPILPSEARRPYPSTPLTHENDEGNDLPPFPSTPSNPSTPYKHPSLSRRSIAHLTPGPYMSPLSSSLSAVVADSIRKGRDPPSEHRRPRLSGLRNMRRQRDTVASTGDVPTVSTPVKDPQSTDVDENHAGSTTQEEGRRVRTRSLSTTLGEFFRLSKERGKGKQNQGAGDDQNL